MYVLYIFNVVFIFRFLLINCFKNYNLSYWNSRHILRPRHTLNENNIATNEVTNDKKLYLLSPRGFCEGVNRAINIVEECLKYFPHPIYVKHEIVHNELVCNTLRKKGVIFVEDLSSVPEKSMVVFSAHGVSPQVRKEAEDRQLVTIDASCPLVNKVHVYVKMKSQEGYKIILIGHKDHVETIGTSGEAPESTTIVETVEDVDKLNFAEDDKLFYVTQTTLSLDDCKDIANALKAKYPKIQTIPSGSICYATTNRQTAVQQIAPLVDLILVVGSSISSNANRLVESGLRRKVDSVLINSPEEISSIDFSKYSNVALTSSASTPESITAEIVNILTDEPYNYTLELYKAVDERVPKWKFPKNLIEMVKERTST